MTARPALPLPPVTTIFGMRSFSSSYLSGSVGRKQAAEFGIMPPVSLLIDNLPLHLS
jgi:hypothetical protein